MHKYIILRGFPRYIRRVIEDLQDVYLERWTKDGKSLGKIQLAPREVKLIELVFPVTARKVIKEKVKEIAKRHNHVTIHFGFNKKDKFVDGKEFL